MSSKQGRSESALERTGAVRPRHAAGRACQRRGSLSSRRHGKARTCASWPLGCSARRHARDHRRDVTQAGRGLDLVAVARPTSSPGPAPSGPTQAGPPAPRRCTRKCAASTSSVRRCRRRRAQGGPHARRQGPEVAEARPNPGRGRETPRKRHAGARPGPKAQGVARGAARPRRRARGAPRRPRARLVPGRRARRDPDRAGRRAGATGPA